MEYKTISSIEVIGSISTSYNKNQRIFFNWNYDDFEFHEISDFPNLLNFISKLSTNCSEYDFHKCVSDINQIIEKRYVPFPDELLQRKLHTILINFLLENAPEEYDLYHILKILLFLANGSSDFLIPFYSSDLIIILLKLVQEKKRINFFEFNNFQVRITITIFQILSKLLGYEKYQNKLIEILMTNNIVEISLESIQKTSSDSEAKVILDFLNILILDVHNVIPEHEIKFIPMISGLAPFLKIQSVLIEYFVDIFCVLINSNECFFKIAIDYEIPNIIFSTMNSFTFSSFLKLTNCLCKYGIINQFETLEFQNLIINLFHYLEVEGLKEFIIFIEQHNFDDLKIFEIIEQMTNVLQEDNFQKKIVACEFFIQHFLDFVKYFSSVQMKIIIISFMEILTFLPYDILQKCLNHFIFVHAEYHDLFQEAAELTLFNSTLQELSNTEDENLKRIFEFLTFQINS